MNHLFETSNIFTDISLPNLNKDHSHYQIGSVDEFITSKFSDSKLEELHPSIQSFLTDKLIIKHKDPANQVKEARIGSIYQADLPDLEINPSQKRKLCRKIWDSKKLNIEVTTNYINTCKEIYFKEKRNNIIEGSLLDYKIEEISLKILHLCLYDVDKAINFFRTKATFFIEGNQ